MAKEILVFPLILCSVSIPNKTNLSLTRNMSEIEMLNMELSKLPKMDGLKIMRISKESFKRISEVYRFLLDKINIEDSKASFQIGDSDSLR